MSSLIGKGFQERTDLQRRQAFHQHLLDSQRFRDSTPRPATGEGPGVTEEDQFRGFPPVRTRANPSSGGEGLAGKVAIALALVFFFYTIPAALVSAVIAMLYSGVVTTIVRRDFVNRFRVAFHATFIAVTVAVIAAVAVIVLLH